MAHSTVGLGSADLGMTLDGGWNLIAFNNKVDTKVPETIKAAGDFIPSALSALAVVAPAADGDPALLGPAQLTPAQIKEQLEPKLYRVYPEKDRQGKMGRQIR